MSTEPGNPPRNGYDELPYPAAAYPQTHPSRLQTLAHMFGVAAPDIQQCRVLELACADGANLIPMACALPESTFLGVDLCKAQVDAGKEIIATLGLRNIELSHLDIAEFDANSGLFDYVIAHGVYSWVPAEVQQQILRICARHLSETGVAFVSYNTNPGWRMRGMLRDMMLFHSRKFDSVQEQIEQARALVDWLASTVDAETSAYGKLLKAELEQIKQWRDYYFRHDSLAEINEPLYFHQFVERAEQHGLQYLAEAEFPSMLASNYSAAVNGTLDLVSRDIIEMEQYMDFLRNRLFRQTLLCHRELKLNRSLGPWNIGAMHVTASLEPVCATPNLAPDQPESFQSATGNTVSTSHALTKAALVCLTGAWPRALAVSDLPRLASERLAQVGHPVEPKELSWDTHSLTATLLTAYGKGFCDLQVSPGIFVVTPSERPRACELARLQAARACPPTNRRHERVMLDAFGLALLPLLDGSRDRESLLDALTRLVERGTLHVHVDDQPSNEATEVRLPLKEELERQLVLLGRSALLIA